MPEGEEMMAKWKKPLTLCISAVITWSGPPNIGIGYYKGI
jgi:hypothetical protein